MLLSRCGFVAFRLAEVAHLDLAIFDQGFEAEVDAADIDAHFFGQGALRHTRVFKEQLGCLKQGVVVRGLAAGGHLNSAEI